MNIINEFNNEYFFLSNFYPKPFIFDGIEVKTSEHIYQALKAQSFNDFKWILDSPTPGESKRRGRKINIRKDWNNIKLGIMNSILEAKFSDKKLFQKLQDTKGYFLIEGNTWHDNFWGSCQCEKCSDIKSLNHLGELLMIIRSSRQLYFRKQ